jgi:hypothetical protein
MSVSKSGTGNNYYSKDPIGGTSNFPTEAYREKRALFVNDLAGRTSVDVGRFVGDRIFWHQQEFAALRVIRSNGGEQIPRFPGVSGASGWGVDLTDPPTIEFSTPLMLDEHIYIIQPVSRETIFKPELGAFSTDRFEVSAGGSQSTFTLSRPGKLSFNGGVYRGQTVQVFIDGILQRPNTPGSTDGDYDENTITGTDSFGSITFNDPVGDPLVAINVTADHKGFYDSDNISTQQLISQGSRITDLETLVSLEELRMSNVLIPNVFGSTDTEVIRFQTTDSQIGSSIIQTTSAANGTQITFNKEGVAWFIIGWSGNVGGEPKVTITKDSIAASPASQANIVASNTWANPSNTLNGDQLSVSGFEVIDTGAIYRPCAAGGDPGATGVCYFRILFQPYEV